jgi:hypothetical protein
MMRGSYTILFFLTLILIHSCATQNTSNMKDQPLTIMGIALNGKAGALVKSLDGEVYYIDGLSSWSTDLINKQVTVTGNLKIETISTDELKNEQGDWKQGILGKIKTVQNANWKLLTEK